MAVAQMSCKPWVKETLSARIRGPTSEPSPVQPVGSMPGAKKSSESRVRMSSASVGSVW